MMLILKVEKDYKMNLDNSTNGLQLLKLTIRKIIIAKIVEYFDDVCLMLFYIYK